VAASAGGGLRWREGRGAAVEGDRLAVVPAGQTLDLYQSPSTRGRNVDVRAFADSEAWARSRTVAEWRAALARRQGKTAVVSPLRNMLAKVTNGETLTEARWRQHEARFLRPSHLVAVQPRGGGNGLRWWLGPGLAERPRPAADRPKCGVITQTQPNSSLSPPTHHHPLHPSCQDQQSKFNTGR
jgi:hypothetical protein